MLEWIVEDFEDSHISLDLLKNLDMPSHLVISGRG